MVCEISMVLTRLLVVILVLVLRPASGHKKVVTEKRSLVPKDPEVYFPTNVEEIPVHYLPRKALKLEINSEGQFQGLQSGMLAHPEEPDSEGAVPEADGPRKATARSLVMDEAVGQHGLDIRSESSKLLEDNDRGLEADSEHEEAARENDGNEEADENEAKLRAEQGRGWTISDAAQVPAQDLKWSECQDTKAFKLPGKKKKIGAVWEMLWSPDGVHIAVRAGGSPAIPIRYFLGPKEPGPSKAFVLRSDGTEKIQFLSQASSIGWSKTGQLILAKTSTTQCSISYWGPDDSGEWQEVKTPVTIQFKQKGCSGITWSQSETWWAVSSTGRTGRAFVHFYQMLGGGLKHRRSLNTGFRGALQLRMSPSGQHVFLWQLFSFWSKRGGGFFLTRSGPAWKLTGRMRWGISTLLFFDAALPQWSKDSKWLAVPIASAVLQFGGGGWKRAKPFPGGVSAWSPQNHLASRISNSQPNFRVWGHMPKGGFVQTLHSQVVDVGELKSMAWSPNGQHLACGGPEGRVVIVSDAGADLFALKDTKPTPQGNSTSHKSLLWSQRMSWSPDGIYLATAAASLHVWKVSDVLSLVWEQDQGVPLTVAWSPKLPDMELATAYFNGDLRIWTMKGDLLSSINMGQGTLGDFRFYCISWSSDGQELATIGNYHRNVKIWERKGSGLVLQTTLGTEDRVRDMSWSTSGHLAAATWGGNNIIIWRKRKNEWKVVQDLKRPTSVVTLAWSPDGSRLASTNNIGIEVWHFLDETLALETALSISFTSVTWSADSKQFMVRLREKKGRDSKKCLVARLGKKWDFTAYLTLSGNVEEVAWSPNLLNVAIADKGDSYAVNLYQVVQSAIGSWPAQMSVFQTGPTCDENSRCIRRKLGLVDLQVVANATDVAWGMFPCTRSRSLWGQQRYNLVSLTLRWPERRREITWSNKVTTAKDLCSKVFASFESLESLRLEEPRIKGRFSCEEQNAAFALQKIEILGGLMTVPAWSLESLMLTSPELKQVRLVKIPFLALEGSPGHGLVEIALEETDLRGIARPFLGANVLLDCPGNPNLQLPYMLTDSCEVAEDIGPICLEQRPSAKQDVAEFQAFVLQEDQWVKGARLRVDSSRLCQPGSVYQISLSGKSGCEPCPTNTFSSNISVSEDVNMICQPCKENQVTNGTATSLDDCLCMEKYTKDGTNCKLCTELPGGEAYECELAGLTVETVPVKEGFWRDNDNDTTPLRCGRPGEPLNGCEGGPPGNICRAGHSGFKCRQCEDLHFLREGECVRCTTDQLQNPTVLLDLGIAGSLVLGSAFAFRFARRRLRSVRTAESPDSVRQDLLEPPKPQDALKSYLMREVMASIQVYQLFGVLSKILPQKKQRVEARILDNLNIGPVLMDGLHLDCLMPFTKSRLLHLLLDPLVPLPLLLGFYLSILFTVKDKEKRTKMWTNFRMKAFNILLIPTVGSIFNAGLCDGDPNPPVMMTAPEVSCTSPTYFSVSIFVTCLGCLYMISAAFMILRTLARYNILMQKAKFILPCHHFDEKKRVLKIFCTGQDTGDLQTACLEAAEIHYQQLLDDSKLSLADVPEDADYRLLNVERTFATEVVEAPLTERSVAYFKALVVRCVMLQLDKEARHGDIRGMTDILTKFCPDSFHFFLFLKVGQVLIAYVPSLEGNRAQGAVGSFVCSILAIGLLSQPFSRPSEGRTLFAGLLALGLAFFLVMLSETHLNLQGEESLTRLMQIARCFQVVPMMRVLIPVACFVSKGQRDRSVDFKQEQLLRTAAWKDVPSQKRQPFRLSKPATLELSDLPMTIKKGDVVLPLRCLEKHMEVEVRAHDRVVTGLVPLAALKPQIVAVKDLNALVSQLKAEKVIATSDWTKYAGSGPVIWYNAKTQEIAWSEPAEMQDKGPLWRVAIDFKSKVSLSAIQLTHTKGSRCSMAVHSTDSGIWPVPDNVQEIKFQEEIEMKVDKHFLQYHLHCDINHCTLLLSPRAGLLPDAIELGDASASSSGWKLMILGDVRNAPKARPESRAAGAR